MNRAFVVLLSLAVGVATAADTNRERGKTSAKGVLSQWGTSDKFKDRAMMPLGSNSTMTTIDGATSFKAQIACEGAKSFMKLTLIPNSTGDIDSIPVSIDSNFDGSSDQDSVLPGPFAAMCDNGMIRCDAGTMTNCNYQRWKVDAAGLSLNPNNDGGNPNSIKDMGACYCFNNSCGNGLLLRNAEKILDDAGGGIALAMSNYVPRFALSSKSMIDTTSAEYFGQTAGCGLDQRPEQYYKNTAGLEAKGVSNRSDSDSLYNKILASDTAKGHTSSDQSCSINRNVEVAEYWNDSALVITASSGTTVLPCGQGCIQVITSNTRVQAGCGIWTSAADVTVNRPDLVTSASLDNVSFDDWVRIRINGGIVWNVDPGWTYEGARCGENKNRGSRSVNMDITSHLSSAAPGSRVQLRTDLSWSDIGSAYAAFTIRYKQDCRVSGETISNGCQGQESDTQCTLRDETVDTTQTLKNYVRTGLQPLPQTRTYTVNGCSQTVTRDYFEKRRIYSCQSSELPYDGEAAERRYNSIHGSFDTETGSFTDTRYENGAYVTSSERFDPLPPKDPVDACPMVCRTSKPRPGVAVGEPGPTNQLNPNGVAQDFTWKECNEDNSCPADPGETVVTPCGCRNNFGEAAAAMQTLRQMSQDSVCQAQ